MARRERSAFYAHTRHDGGPWEPLHEHLSLVAARAREHAAVFGAGDEAYLTGLLHDLGKYGEAFQRRLEGIGGGLDHWTLGGWAALTKAKPHGWAAAMAIEGHHVGLCDGNPASKARFKPEKFGELHPPHRTQAEPDLDRAFGLLEREGLRLPSLTGSVWRRSRPKPRSMLAIRMLFSALVDADYVETEAFIRGDGRTRSYRAEGPALEPMRALEVLRAELARLSETSTAAPQVTQMRTDLLADCLAAAEEPRGTFTLTAPTGSGKTLAMLAFALAHAARHSLRRIVVAIPFLSIIEQTAGVYRDLFVRAGFPPHFLLEHHSLSDRDVSEDRASEDDLVTVDGYHVRMAEARLLAENWDAPIVVTTNVQLLESLFAHKPRACRKLHNLAGSVILFDEAQTIPPELAPPTLAALGTLVRDFGCSVAFATATQPAFGHLDRDVRRYSMTATTDDDETIGWKAREIVGNACAMFNSAKRTKVLWQTNTPIDWDELAGQVLDESDQALVIVNLKRHARELTEALNDRGVTGLLHLSTNLCPDHRARVLADARDRLDQARPCVLVSTQCVEAGVDVDFPRVFRALGPLDSIAQAAGRCNRNGKADEGRVIVFRPRDERYPPGAYEQAARVTASLLSSGPLPIDDPEVFARYYRDFYDLTRIASGDDSELEDAIRSAHFPSVAERYRLIDADTIQIVVRWDEDLIDELRNLPLDREWLRRARPSTVSIYRPKQNSLERAPPTRRGDVSQGYFLLDDPDAYDRDLFGLTLADQNLWIA